MWLPWSLAGIVLTDSNWQVHKNSCIGMRRHPLQQVGVTALDHPGLMLCDEAFYGQLAVAQWRPMGGLFSLPGQGVQIQMSQLMCGL